jgi:hypothetical protein
LLSPAHTAIDELGNQETRKSILLDFLSQLGNQETRKRNLPEFLSSQFNHPLEKARMPPILAQIGSGLVAFLSLL